MAEMKQEMNIRYQHWVDGNLSINTLIQEKQMRVVKKKIQITTHM